MDDPDVRAHLQPLQGRDDSNSSSSKRPRDEEHLDGTPEKTKRHIEQLKNELRNLKSGKSARQTRSDKFTQSKGAGKSSQKGKSKSSPIRMPKELIGMHGFTEDGERLCFDYNLNGCTKAKPGEKCAKGCHVCAKCLKADHGARACRA